MDGTTLHQENQSTSISGHVRALLSTSVALQNRMRDLLTSKQAYLCRGKPGPQCGNCRAQKSCC